MDLVVQPKREGVTELVLQVRPVVLIPNASLGEELPANTEATALPLPIRLHATATSGDKARGWFEGIANFLTSAAGIVTAVTTLVVALAGLLAALPAWRRKRGVRVTPPDVLALVRCGWLEEVQPGVYTRPRLPSRAEVHGDQHSTDLQEEDSMSTPKIIRGGKPER